jgi:hypothetical protein
MGMRARELALASEICNRSDSIEDYRIDIGVCKDVYTLAPFFCRETPFIWSLRSDMLNYRRKYAGWIARAWLSACT